MVQATPPLAGLQLLLRKQLVIPPGPLVLLATLFPNPMNQENFTGMVLLQTTSLQNQTVLPLVVHGIAPIAYATKSLPLMILTIT